MNVGALGSFGAQLKALREAAGFTQEELATIAGLSVHAISALERGERRHPQPETVRALSAALDLTGATRDAFLGSARRSAGATDEPPGASLPLPLTALLGRDTEIQTLRQWVADPVSRLTTLIGPGGVGKTRLALELARTIAQERTSRVVFVSLSAIQDATFVAPAIAEALGLLDVSAADLPRRARAACGDRPTLLVLDNFEHVLGAAPLVGELLSLTLSLRALVTSRAALRVRGEREYALGPLELALAPDAMSPADLARVPAIRLFVERIREVQPEFRLTSANGATVAAICRRLDALPLALELAAPWIKVLTLDGLLQRLERGSLLGAIGVRDLPARQQTMNATVAWSYQLLDAEEQRAFRSFGALPGPFSIDAATAVLAGADPSSDRSDQALRSAAALIDKSLLLRSDTSPAAARPLYHMLETVRAYAALELVATSERDEAMQGLVRYCTTRASLAAEGIVGPAQPEWLDRVREDLESYRAAMAWLIERRRAAEAVHIAWSLLWFWQIRGHGAEGLRWYQQILNLPQLPVAAEARALLGSAAMWYGQGELPRARTALTRALTMASDANDVDAVMHAQFILGHVEQALGNFAAARDCFTQSVAGFEPTRSVWAKGHLLTALAWVALCTGDIVQTEHLLDAADAPLRRAGPFFRSLGMYLRALLALRRGDASAALALVRDSLAVSHELKDRFACLYSLVPLAAAAALEGDDEWVARVVGVQDAVTDSTGATVVDTSVQDLRKKVERDARARLGAERWARAYAAGRKISIDALIKDIDSSRP